jgi:glycine/D-amino acid oxidase-like deaminating enzyme/nitrite reductase/ring-hydroxylating ferredoxin subunit
MTTPIPIRSTGDREVEAMMNPAGPPPRYSSYWKRTTAPSRFSPASGRIHVDVAVVGGGIAGLTTAFLLKSAGLRVAVLEADRVGGGASGASLGRLTALERLTYAAMEQARGREATRTYAAANQWALTWITEIVHRLGIECALHPRPGLVYTTDPNSTRAIEREIAAAGRAGLAVQGVDASDLPFPIEAGGYVPDEAHFNPLRYCQGLAHVINVDGSSVFEGSRVVEVDGETQPLSVQTSGGARILASWVVMASGLPPIDRGGFFARTVPFQTHCVALEAKTPLPTSMALGSIGPVRSLVSVPRPGQLPLLLVQGEEHRPGAGGDARDHYAGLEAFARQHFAVGEVAARWASQGYAATDGIPLVGRVPFGSPHLLVATGLGTGGLTMGSAAGRIVADMILDRPNSWLGLFEAGRSRFPPSVWDKLRNEFAGTAERSWKGQEDPPESVPPGSAAICRLDGESVAVFRDHDGTLYVLSSTCTHRGCQVVWNPAERTWDCPCHGSRFGLEGQVLHGPAVSPLRQI